MKALRVERAGWVSGTERMSEPWPVEQEDDSGMRQVREGGWRQLIQVS